MNFYQYIKQSMARVYLMYFALYILNILIQLLLIKQIMLFGAWLNSIHDLSLLYTVIMITILHETLWRMRDYIVLILTAKIRCNVLSDIADIFIHKNYNNCKQTKGSMLSNIRILSESVTTFVILLTKIFGGVVYVILAIFSSDFVIFIALIIFLCIWICIYIYTIMGTISISDKIGHSFNDFIIDLSRSLNNIDNIIIYDTYECEKQKYKDNINKLRALEIQFGKILFKRWVIQGYLFIAILFGVIYYTSLIELNIGKIIALAALLREFFLNLWFISEHIGLIIELYGKIHNNLSILDISDTKASTAIQCKVKNSEKIELKNVEYILLNHTLVCNNITIGKGEKVLIYGQSGTGKTTILELILGLITINKGLLCNDFYGNIAYIPQSPHILGQSIEYDIRYGGSNKADLHLLNKYKSLSFILQSKNALKLSRGEIQKLFFARALVLDKKAIIMDEPTASLDADCAKELMEAIWQKYETIIIVSHDLTLCQDLHIDRIIKAGDDFKII